MTYVASAEAHAADWCDDFDQRGTWSLQAMKLRQPPQNSPLGGEPHCFSDNPEERVHDLRVALKKMRALLRLIRTEIPREAFRREDLLLKRAAGRLAPHRDAAVIQQTLNKALRKCHGATQTCLALWVETLRVDWPRRDLAGAVGKADEGAALHAIEQFTQWARQLGQRVTSDPSLLRHGLKWTYKRARKKLRRAIKTGDPEHFHECRIWVKWLYFQIKTLEVRLPQSITAFVLPLEKLQEDLGKHHDAHLAWEFIRQGGLPETANRHVRRLTEALERRGQALERRTKRRKGLFALDPKLFVRELMPSV
jgi:CHAD domain-containing protein